MALAKGSMDASQAEFAQLQREYRHMELNRKSYADESYGVLRMGQDLIHVNPPKLEDYSSEEEDDNDDTRPLTRDEIKAKTLTKMYQRSKAGDPVTTKSRKKKASRSSF